MVLELPCPQITATGPQRFEPAAARVAKLIHCDAAKARKSSVARA